MKRTLFEGGVRGVGLVSGAGLAKKGPGVVLDGYFHAADCKLYERDRFPSANEYRVLTWCCRLCAGMPTILAAATPPSLGKSWLDIATAGAQEPPFLPGDGMDLWPYLSGAVENSSRTEILHEAHAQGSTDGNGNALRVGDWKIVMRTGGQWNHLDGWYGGPESSDTRSGACKCSRSLCVVRRPHCRFFDT